MATVWSHKRYKHSKNPPLRFITPWPKPPAEAAGTKRAQVKGRQEAVTVYEIMGCDFNNVGLGELPFGEEYFLVFFSWWF